MSSGQLDLWPLDWGKRTDLEKHRENAGEPETLKMEHQRGSYGMGGAREHNPGDTVLEGGARAREDREGWGQGPERWQVLHGRCI